MKKLSLSLIVVFVLSLVLVSCYVATTTSGSCAFVVGDGTFDADVHQIIYPGQNMPQTGVNENVRYVPCNSRTYIVNDGTKVNANGQQIGDMYTPIKAKTMTGTDVLVQISAYWTLNENPEALKAFYAYQLKFDAASTSDLIDSSGNVNSSTPGWNSMLGESFEPALERTTRQGLSLVTDEIWQSNDIAQTKILTDYVTDNLQAAIRQTIGYSATDLMCGSNSDWTDHNNPGSGEYICKPIIVVVDSVVKDPNQTNASTEGSIDLSKQRLKVAQELYGVNAASCVLAAQDIVQAGSNTGATNVFNINIADCFGNSSTSGNTPAIVLPSTQP